MDTSNEPKKSIWKKSWKGPRGFLLWGTLLVVATFLVVFAIGSHVGISRGDSAGLASAGAIAVGTAVIVGLAVLLIRWLCSWRNLRKALFGLACLLTLIALFYVEEDARGKWAWNRFKHQWEAKGEKFDVDSLVPPAVPDDQNFAMMPIVASTYASMIDKTGHEVNPRNTNIVDRLVFKINHGNDWNTPANGNWAKGTLTDFQPWQAYYRNPPTNGNSTVATNEFPIAPGPQSPAADVLLALSKYDSALEELRQASQLPESRFPLEYDKKNPAMILLPHLARVKGCALLLQLRALAELQAGQAEKAAADVKLTLYLNGSISSEPFLISHLVRIAAWNITLQPIYEGLAQHKWTDTQLTALDSELAKFDFLADYKRTMRSEVAFTAKMIDYVEHAREINDFFNLFNNGQPSNPWLDYLCFASPAGWFHQNQISFAKFYLEQCRPVVDLENRKVSPDAARKAEENLDSAIAHPNPYNALQHIFLSPFKNQFFDKYVAANKFAFAQESVDMARIAIALERYRLAHESYPESLNELAPQFIKQIPRDIVGGQALKYRRTDAAFVLYSVGWNEKDDGGIPAFTKDSAQDWENGDWVWEYPTK